jgi:hypothetical protein
MGHIRGALALLLLALPASGAFAGERAPGEADLLAGYCLGVSQAFAATAAAWAGDPAFCRGTEPEGECREAFAGLAAEAEARRWGLARHISARGYLPGGRMGRWFRDLDAMRERGQAEHAACDAHAASCAAPCREEGGGAPCLRTCRAEAAACARVDRCLRAATPP